MRTLREETFAKYAELKETYLEEFVELEGTQNYLNAKQNYPLLLGTAANSYKCFVTRAWGMASERAIQGFLHPEGTYDRDQEPRTALGLRQRCISGLGSRAPASSQGCRRSPEAVRLR